MNWSEFRDLNSFWWSLWLGFSTNCCTYLTTFDSIGHWHVNSIKSIVLRLFDDDHCKLTGRVTVRLTHVTEAKAMWRSTLCMGSMTFAVVADAVDKPATDR